MMKNLLLLPVLLVLFGIEINAQNNCLEFDGTDDYLDCGNSTSFEISNGTIEVWFKVDQLDQMHTLVSKYLSGGFNNNLLLRTNESTNKIWFYLDGTSTYAAINSDNAITSNTWYHVAIQWGSSGMKMYVNGILQSETNAVTYPLIASGGNFLMGSYYAGVSNGYIEHLNGNLDEVRIWNDVLTESEIRQNMYRELTDPSGEANLVAYYKLNETSGTTATDSKGSNNGTLTNYGGQSGYWQTSPAMFGPKNCLDFDGDNDHIRVNTTLSPALTQGTISFWIKPKATPGNNARVFSDHWEDDEIFLQSGTGKVGTHHMINGDELMSSNPLPNNQWTHVAFTMDNTSSKLYINGVLDDESGPADISISDNFEIGGYSTNFPGYPEVVNGNLDEFRIWSDVRTEAEIREYIFKNLNGNEDNLVAYYSFDNTSGTVLQDFSGNGHDGTLTNMDGNSDWVTSSAFSTWLNTTSSSWATATNWSGGSVPGSSDNLGIINYTGGSNPVISGSPTVNHFLLGSSATITFTSGLTVNGYLFLKSNADLNGQTVTLGSSAYLFEEDGRFYGTSGNITTTRTLSNIDENVAGLGAEITTSANMGSTTIARSHAAASDPVSITRRYTITPTNNSSLNATLVFHYDENELNGLNESQIGLYKSTDDGVTWIGQGGGRNLIEKIITLNGIDAFSDWTAAELATAILETNNPSQDYTSGAAAVIVAATTSITYAEDITAATVSISPIVEGDILSVSNLPGGLSSDWNNTTKILTISGTGSASEYQTVLRNVKFQTTSQSAGTRTIDFNLGNGIGLSIEGQKHFYQVLGSGSSSITWYNARANALASSYAGAAGYLATITTETENGYLKDKVTRDTWIGGSDEAAEGVWIWMDGPEAGTQFWQGGAGGTTVNGSYANWWSGEPNNANNNEDYCHMRGTEHDPEYWGYWNDYSNNNPSALYYIVEYGGDGTVFTTMDDATVEVLGMMWNGSTDSDWATGDNWSTGSVPGAEADITIPDVSFDPVIASGTGASCNNLTVNSGASLTINSGGSLITTGSIFNSGTMQISRTLSESQWHLISVPVEGVTAGNFTGEYLQSWDEENGVWINISDPETAMNTKQGYSLWAEPGKADDTFTFTGTLLTGNQSTPITYHSVSGKEFDGANLLGNPYPSSIDWDQLQATYGSNYIWDGTAYKAYSAQAGYELGYRYIPPLQGFFIITNASGNFDLSNDARTHEGATNFYKSDGHKSFTNGIVLQTSNGSYTDEWCLVFKSDATENFELPNDAWKLLSGTLGLSQLWSECPEGKLSIDIRPETQTIQLGFANDQPGAYSIGLSQIADIASAMLEDTKNGIFHNLQNGSYHFTWNPDLNNEMRFKLHLNSVGIEETPISESDILIYAANGQIFIKTATGVETHSLPRPFGGRASILTVSDVMGRVVLRQEISGEGLISVPVNLQIGVYLVTLQNGNEVKTEKVFIK